MNIKHYLLKLAGRIILPFNHVYKGKLVSSLHNGIKTRWKLLSQYLISDQIWFRIVNKELKAQFLMSSTVYDDVPDFEVCGFIRIRKIYVSWELNNFFFIEKNYLVYIKGYNMAKNNFLAEVIFYWFYSAFKIDVTVIDEAFVKNCSWISLIWS